MPRKALCHASTLNSRCERAASLSECVRTTSQIKTCWPLRTRPTPSQQPRRSRSWAPISMCSDLWSVASSSTRTANCPCYARCKASRIATFPASGASTTRTTVSRPTLKSQTTSRDSAGSKSRAACKDSLTIPCSGNSPASFYPF